MTCLLQLWWRVNGVLLQIFCLGDNKLREIGGGQNEN